MEIILNIFLIAVCCVIVIDVLQFFDNLNPILSKLFGFRVKLGKPFTCSTCSSFWLGLLYLIISGSFSLKTVTLLLAVSASTPLLNTLWWNIQGIIGLIINLLKIRT